MILWNNWSIEWELYLKVSFDGPTKKIYVHPEVNAINVKIDLYSAWKRWVAEYDNIKYLQAFRAVGGDPVGGGQYTGDVYFLMNGWQIIIDHAVAIVGTIYHDDQIAPFIIEEGGGVTATVSTQAYAYNVPAVVNTDFTEVLNRITELENKVNDVPTNTELTQQLATTSDATADSVWNALLANYQLNGSAGKALSTTSTGGVDIQALVNAIWSEPLDTYTNDATPGNVLMQRALEDTVFIDPINGIAGDTFPVGTSNVPVNNLANALIIAAKYKLVKLHITGSLTITSGQNVSGYTIKADRSVGNYLTINSGAITNLTYIQDLTVTGTMGGPVRFTSCVLNGIQNFDGGAKNCLITGPIHFTGTGNNYLTECDVYTSTTTTYMDMFINGRVLNLIRCRGNFGIKEKNGPSTLVMDLTGGRVYVYNTCTSGTIEIYGIAEVVKQTGTTTVVDVMAVNPELIAKSVWDEPLTGAAHNIPQSAGRKLRQIASGVIYEGIATSATNNTIVLDLGASAEDGAYDPAEISITSGLGFGQTRGILQYDGATRTAVVDRNWKVLPGVNSNYAITAWSGREHVNEGLARGPGSGLNTIILNINASDHDDAYTGQTIFIRSGTGEDQACKIMSYNGTTKEATVFRNWETPPNNTSAYVILPTGILGSQIISDAVWKAPVEGMTTVGSIGEYIKKKVLSVAKFIGLK